MPPKIHAYAYRICGAWYISLHIMATKPIKFLELYYTMTQFLIIPDIVRSILHCLSNWTVTHKSVLFVLPARFRNVEYAVIRTIIGSFSKSTRRCIEETNFDVKCQENVKTLMTLFIHSFVYIKKASYLRKELVSVFCF